MNINPLLWPTLALALLAFLAGNRLMRRVSAAKARVGYLLCALLLAAPAALLAVYYLHWFDDALWYYQFRTAPGTELTAACAGLLLGMLPALIPRKGGFFGVSSGGALALLLVLLLIP